jgi:hypothetical protein
MESSLLARGFSLVCAVALLTGCGDFTKEVELDVPFSGSELAVECYIEPDSAFRVSLTETVPFFSLPTSIPLVTNATVSIAYNDTIVPLSFSALGNPGNQYPFGEYRSAPGVKAPRNFNTTFRLLVTDPKGRRATAETKIVAPIAAIDTTTFTYTNNNRDVSIQSYWSDPDPGAENYYRITYDFGEPDSILSIERTDFARNGPTDFSFTPPSFRPKQTVLIRMMHISKAYYDFYQSVERAQRGNTNPFQEPGRIIDNITGGTGIFTGLGVLKKSVYIPVP